MRFVCLYKQRVIEQFWFFFFSVSWEQIQSMGTLAFYCMTKLPDSFNKVFMSNFAYLLFVLTLASFVALVVQLVFLVYISV